MINTIVICCSTSVGGWWSKFCSLHVVDVICWRFDAVTPSADDVVRMVSTFDRMTTSVAVLSEHETLQRDAVLVDTLRSVGYRVAGCGTNEAMFEWNKPWAKQLFDRLDIVTPAWSLTRPGSICDSLFKQSAGTQSKNVLWADSQNELGEAKGYFETYVQGTEYSAIVFAREKDYTILPLVWKGATNAQLIPPFERLRLCGEGVPATSDIGGLDSAIERIANAICSPCLLEIEFIVDEHNQYHIIEVNPRIAGTTRLAAMAGDGKIIDLMFLAPKAVSIRHRIGLPKLCAELPVVESGEPFSSDSVFATSRLSIVGGSTLQVWERFLVAESLGWKVQATARNTLEALVNIDEGIGEKWRLT